MNYRKIAYVLLDKTEKDSLLLTQQQIDYLAFKIDELPQSYILQLDGFSESDVYTKDLLDGALRALRNDERLMLTLSLGAMSTVDLIDSLACIVSGLYSMSIEPVGTDYQLVFKSNLDNQDEDPTAQMQGTCLLQRLFGAKIAQKKSHFDDAYAYAINIFAAKGILGDPIMLSKNFCNALKKDRIETNADLIRWYREIEKMANPEVKIGEIQRHKIEKYIDYWFSAEKQRLLSSAEPH
jgi:hypothetical protein